MNEQLILQTYSNPGDWGAPPGHNEFRGHQLETILSYLKLSEPGETSLMITAQKTGSGKSMTARGIVNPPHLPDLTNRVVVLTEKKSLQAAYRETYGAEILYGRSNYNCIHPAMPPSLSCDDCVFLPQMADCPYSAECEYVVAKRRAQRAKFACLNYHLWLGLFSSWPEIDYLVCDEGHNLHRLVVAHFSSTVTLKDIHLYGLPRLVAVNNQMPTEAQAKVISAWLYDAVARMIEYVELKQDGVKRSDQAELKALRRARFFGRRLLNSYNALAAAPKDWFIKSPRIPKPDGEKGTRPGVLIKPLTAKHHAERILTGKQNIIMSATIGQPKVFIGGLVPDKPHVWRDVPSLWLPQTRPVFDLPVPRMSAKSTGADYHEQAKQTAELILSVDHGWSGLLHVTRKKEAAYLANRLAGLGLGDRVWAMPDHISGTENQVATWKRRLRQVSNSIGIVWSFWSGYDGLQEKITGVMKAPFPYLGDEFERARLQYSRSLFLQETAWLIEQALGRCRRGRLKDYDIFTADVEDWMKFMASHLWQPVDGWAKRGLAFIADRNWRRCQKYLSQDLLNSIVRI